MFEDRSNGVVIAGMGAGLRLSRAAFPLDPELGNSTLIEIQAGPFTGAVRDDTVGSYVEFAKQLETLHRQLSGTATLGSYEGFALTFSGNGRGGIIVSGAIRSEYTPLARLTFEFQIDQSYLPQIIKSINAEFLIQNENVDSDSMNSGR